MLYTQNIIVGTSPFSYQNRNGYLSEVFVAGGTVSAIEFSRDKVSFLATPSPVSLAPGDWIRVTYTVAPAMTLVPMGLLL